MQNLLDGQSFTGELGLKNEPWHTQDILSFADGMLHSRACDQYKFNSGLYHAQTDGAHISFSAETTNPSGEKMLWRGSVQNDRLVGTVRHMKDGKLHGVYWIRARAEKQRQDRAA